MRGGKGYTELEDGLTESVWNHSILPTFKWKLTRLQIHGRWKGWSTRMGWRKSLLHIGPDRRPIRVKVQLVRVGESGCETA